MTAAVYRHGAPPAWPALAALLCEEQKRELWRMYVADTLHAQCMALFREYNVPSYSELISQAERPKDTRTGQEIIDDIISWLERGD